MIRMFSQTEPPRWMEAVVAFLLPPACREPVLGDLQERFSEREVRKRWVGYLVDVMTTIPHVLRSQTRRVAARGSLCSAEAVVGLRARAEHLQTQVWIRNAAILVSVVLVGGTFLLNARGAWRFQEAVSLAMTIGWVGAVWQSYAVRGRSVSIPALLSRDELRAFHRSELKRQIALGCRNFVYWSMPAVVLIVYGLNVGILRFRVGGILLGALIMQNGLIAWVHRKDRSRYQRELDRMDLEIEQA